MEEKEKRKVIVYKHDCDTWYPLEHYPHPYGTTLKTPEISKEVEDDAFWFNGDEKHIHRIEDDGKRWYVRPPNYEEEKFILYYEHEKEKKKAGDTSDSSRDYKRYQT